MIEIREMKAQDVPQIAELERICFSDPWSAQSIATELDNSLSCWLVAADGEKVVGYVGSQTVLDGSDMMNIAVAPDFRREGLAEALVNALIDCLRQRKSRCLILEVRVSNTPAIDGKPLICAETIAKMKDGVVFVNTSRGNNVDEAALLEALNSGKIRGAGLDVFAEEPTPNKELYSHPNVSCTPHIGAATVEAQKRIGAEIVDIITNF